MYSVSNTWKADVFAFTLQVDSSSTGSENKPPGDPGSTSKARPGAQAGSSSLAEKLENELECVVCRDWMVASHSFAPCGHTFCGECLAGWLEKHHTCPCCRCEAPRKPAAAAAGSTTA